MLDKPESKMGNWEHGSDRVRFIDLHTDSTEEEDEPLEDEEDDLDNDPLNAKAINDEMSLRLSSIQDDAIRMPDKINTLLSKYILIQVCLPVSLFLCLIQIQRLSRTNQKC